MTTVKITPQRKRTLVFFYQRLVSALPMPSMSELADLHGNTTDAVKSHLRAMVKDGLLWISNEPGRRRQYEYQLTAEGRRVARILYERTARKVAEIREQNFKSILGSLGLPRFRQEDG